MDELRFLIELERAEEDFSASGDEIEYRRALRALGFKDKEINESIAEART